MESLPIIAQTIVYRKNSGNYDVLLLKRNENRGGFWSTVNGTLESNESVVACRERELYEEAGIQQVLSWSEELYRFSFDYKGGAMEVLVCAVEVSNETKIILNHEHSEFQWLSFDKAIDLAKYQDDKKGLRICRDRLLKKE